MEEHGLDGAIYTSSNNDSGLWNYIYEIMESRTMVIVVILFRWMHLSISSVYHSSKS